MKKLSLLFVFVLVLVAVLAFSASAKNITKEAAFSMKSGGDLCKPEYVIDDNYFTAASNGNVSDWVDYYFEYETGRTISRIRVIYNSVGENVGVCTYEEISQYANEIICRVKNSSGSQVELKIKDATIVTNAQGKAVYSYIDFVPAAGSSWTDITWINVPTIHSKKAEACIWEIDIFDDEVCTADTHEFQSGICGTAKVCNACGAESTELSTTEHLWKVATCQPKSCSICGVSEGEPAYAHTWVEANCTVPKTCSECKTTEGEPTGIHVPANDDGDCSTAIRCTVCNTIVTAAKKHVADENGACTNEGCNRVGAINVANQATIIPSSGSWWAVYTNLLVDGNKDSSTHAPKSSGFSYTFEYADNKLITKVVVSANGKSNTGAAGWQENNAIKSVSIELQDKDGFKVYETESYKFENGATEVEIVLPYTYYAAKVIVKFSSSEQWGSSFVREIEIYDTTVGNFDENDDSFVPPEGCWDRVLFQDYIGEALYYDPEHGYWGRGESFIFLQDEDGNFILDENGNQIFYAGVLIGGNTNPYGSELDGNKASGIGVYFEGQKNVLQYNFAQKLLIGEITISYIAGGNVNDGYKLYVGNVVDGEEVWTEIADHTVSELNTTTTVTFPLGEDGEGMEATMFRFEWHKGCIRLYPSLTEIEMVTYKSTCKWVETEVLVAGNCGYDRVAKCVCSACGAEKTVVTPASGEHDLSVVANATSATCVDFGLNAVKYCATCEKTFGGDRIEKPTGVHTMGTADCNKNTCLVCGYVDSKVSVSAHTYGWNIGTDENGNQKHGCSVCLTEAKLDEEGGNVSSNLGFTIFYATSVSDLAKTGYDVIRLKNDVASASNTAVKNNAIIDFGGYTYTKTGGRFQLQTIKGIVNGTVKQNHGLNALQVYCVGFIEDFNIIVGATYNDNATGIYMSYNASYGGSYINSIKNLTIDSVRDENGEYINSTTGLFNHGLEFSNTNSVIGTLDNVKVYSRGQAMTLKAKSIGTMTNCVFDGANVALALTELQCGIDLVNCQINSDVLAVYIEKVTTTAGNPIFFQFDADTTISSSGTAFYIIPTSDDYDFDDLTSAVALVDGKLYTSFETALAALKASTAETTTFTLIGDLELDAPIEISKAVQFSLGGGKFKVPVIGTKNFNEYDAPGYVLTASADGAFAVKEGGSLTITGDKGTLVGGENAIVVEEGGSALIVAGTYDGFNPQNYMSSDSCYDIKDGKYTITKNHTYSEELLYGVLYRADGNCNNCGYVRGVARVGDEYFATIEEAIAAAVAYNAVNEEKVSVELAVNIDLEKSLVVSDVVKIVLNGKTISASAETEGDGVFHVIAGGELTISDHTQYFTGTVNGVCASEYDMAIWADGGKVIIEAGIFTNVGAGDDDQYDLIYVKNGGIVEINGGTFIAQTPKWTLNVHDDLGGTISVSGGKFFGFNPQKSESENPVANFTANKCAELDDEGYYVVKNHSSAVLEAKDPTCVETGLTEGSYCSVCEEVLVPQQETPVLDHNYVPVENEDGSITYTCQNGCNDSYVINNALVNGEYYLGTDRVVFNNGVLSAMGSEFTYTYNVTTGMIDTDSAGMFFQVIEGTIYFRSRQPLHTHAVENLTTSVTDPTCTDKGYTTYICMTCGPLYTANEVDALGHTPGEEKIENNIPATSTTAGSYDKVVYCVTCNTVISRETVTVEPTCAHTNTEVIPAVLPLPSNNHTGKTAGLYCLDCETTLVEQNEFSVTQLASNHEFRFRAASIVLDENISVNYKPAKLNGYNNVYVVFVFEGEEYIFDTANYTETTSKGEERYVFNFKETRPQLLASNIAAYVYAETEDGFVMNCREEYSLLEYCVGQLKADKEEAYKAIISNVLVLGAEVQKVMGVNTNALATDLAVAAGCTLNPSEFGTIRGDQNVQAILGDRTTGTDWKAGTFRLGSSTEMVIKFETDSIENLKVKINIAGEDTYIDITEDTEVDEKGRYVVVVDFIKALQFNETVTATFERDGEQIGSELTYSINSYLFKNYEKESDQQAIVKALYVYGQAMYDYVNGTNNYQ